MFQFSLIAAAVCAVAVVVGVPLLRPRPRLPRDPGARAAAVLGVLPGANCGACGSESCFDAASRIASRRVPVTACVTGGLETAVAVARVMRTTAGSGITG